MMKEIAGCIVSVVAMAAGALQENAYLFIWGFALGQVVSCMVMARNDKKEGESNGSMVGRYHVPDVSQVLEDERASDRPRERGRPEEGERAAVPGVRFRGVREHGEEAR